MKLKKVDLLAKGFREAERITQRHAKTFYFASRFLPLEKRHAAYAAYALCRISDQSVDTTPLNDAPQQLELIREKLNTAFLPQPTDDPVMVAFRQTILTYDIPKQYFLDLLDGMSMDLTKNRYKNFAELSVYCYRVAGVVGLIMLKIFGETDPAAQDHAVNLGIAMQLTNIIRDIKEDFLRGRIYLPQDEMLRYGITEDDLSKESGGDAMVSFLKSHIERARGYYEKATPGIALIPNRQSRLVVYLMKDMYAGILRAIEKNNYDVFSRRAYVSWWGKMAIAFKIIVRGDHLYKR